MADEIKEFTEESVDVQKYLDTINELKNNTVSKEDYYKLKDENKTLLNSIMDGTATASAEAASPTAQELRNKLFGKDHEKLSDIEYIESLCDLRDILLKETGTDFMAPTGTQYAADYNDLQTSNKVYNGFRHCLQVADGNEEIFSQEISRITNDTGLPNRFKNRR